MLVKWPWLNNSTFCTNRLQRKNRRKCGWQVFPDQMWNEEWNAGFDRSNIYTIVSRLWQICLTNFHSALKQPHVRWCVWKCVRVWACVFVRARYTLRWCAWLARAHKFGRPPDPNIIQSHNTPAIDGNRSARASLRVDTNVDMCKCVWMETESNSRNSQHIRAHMEILYSVVCNESF